MKKTKRYWIEFQLPFNRVIEVNYGHEPNPQDVEWNDKAISFTIKMQGTIEDDGIEYKSVITQLGPQYFPTYSVIENRDQLSRNPLFTEALSENMKYSDVEKLLWVKDRPIMYDPDNMVIL